jgi:hypothetical protein
MSVVRTYRAGSAIEDYCRACKNDRMHTVMAADASGRPVRVTCGYCRSEHNFRGGPRVDATGPAAAPRDMRPSFAGATSKPASQAESPAPSAVRREVRASSGRDPFPVVSERERSAPPIMVPTDTSIDLELLLRRVIREETGITSVVPAEKWRGGTLVLRPGSPGLQEKSWPIEAFFHKVVMLRNRLRTLEQQVNASDLAEDVKVKLQSYVSGCYGSLTSFNVLFAEESDQFKGSSGE